MRRGKVKAILGTCLIASMCSVRCGGGGRNVPKLGGFGVMPPENFEMNSPLDASGSCFQTFKSHKVHLSK